LFPISLNTEDFVNRVDQAHRLSVYRTTRSRRPGIVAPVEFAVIHRSYFNGSQVTANGRRSNYVVDAVNVVFSHTEIVLLDDRGTWM